MFFSEGAPSSQFRGWVLGWFSGDPSFALLFYAKGGSNLISLTLELPNLYLLPPYETFSATAFACINNNK